MCNVELSKDELKEHKELCVDRPTAWELVNSNGTQREFACKKHGVPEDYDLSEAERLDNPHW